MIILIANYYFQIATLNFKLIIGSLVLLGFLSIAITVWYKIEMKRNFETNSIQIFHYKKSRIIWSALGIGLITIVIGKDLNSQIKILTFSIGIYLVLSQLVEYISGKYFNTNILAITENSLIDLNGMVKEVKYKNIKAYVRKSESFVIQENFETMKFKARDFLNSANMIEILDRILKSI